MSTSSLMKKERIMTTSSSSTTPELIHRIMEEQKETFIDRDEEILASWITLLAGQHMYMLGKPGVAKSMLASNITHRIHGAKLFERLIRKSTTESEIFGPPSISALQKDEYRFVTKGRLADCHIAFLDELGKASSAVANSLLTAINERQFDNGGKRGPIPLLSVFAASNELPQGEEVAAIYDRFLVRILVRDIATDADFLRLLALKDTPIKTKITLDEVQAAVRKVKDVDTSPVHETVNEIRHKLLGYEIQHSARRWRQSLALIRANAYLSGRDKADVDDLEVLRWSLWDTPEERKFAGRAVFSSISPAMEEFLDLSDSIESLWESVLPLLNVNTLSDEQEQRAIQVNRDLRDIIGSLETMEKTITNNNLKERIKQKTKLARDRNTELTKKALKISL